MHRQTHEPRHREAGGQQAATRHQLVRGDGDRFGRMPRQPTRLRDVRGEPGRADRQPRGRRPPACPRAPSAPAPRAADPGRTGPESRGRPRDRRGGRSGRTRHARSRRRGARRRRTHGPGSRRWSCTAGRWTFSSPWRKPALHSAASRIRLASLLVGAPIGQHASSSRLAIRARSRPRCDAPLAPSAATRELPALRVAPLNSTRARRGTAPSPSPTRHQVRTHRRTCRRPLSHAAQGRHTPSRVRHDDPVDPATPSTAPASDRQPDRVCPWMREGVGVEGTSDALHVRVGQQRRSGRQQQPQSPTGPARRRSRGRARESLRERRT